MAWTIQLWEDHGAATGSPSVGTTRQEVDNIGWRDSFTDETSPYVDSPLQRPYGSLQYGLSYTKYNYFKVIKDSGNSYMRDARIQFINTMTGAGNGSGIASGVRLYYKWATSYVAPNNNFLGGSYLNPGDVAIWNPLVSDTGPETAVNQLTGFRTTTFYTQYLVTQLYVEPSAWDDFGNLQPDFKIELTFDEYIRDVSGQYDTTLVSTHINGVYV